MEPAKGTRTRRTRPVVVRPGAANAPRAGRPPTIGPPASGPAPGQDREDPSLARVGAFSDAVFAFAITLLILTIRIPRPTDPDAGAGLLPLLTRQWQGGLAYVLSFLLVGINWTNHRAMFAKFARADHVLVWLNLLHLMVGVAFIPIPAAVLGAWLGHPHDRAVAAVFYGAVATGGALAFDAHWWHGAYAAKLTIPALSARQRRAHTLAWGAAPVAMAALTAVAVAAPVAAVAGYLAVVAAYVLPAPALVARGRRWRRARRPTADR